MIDLVKGLPLLAVLAVGQITIVNPLELIDGPPDLLLVALVALALLRGPVVGAIGGFWTGIIVDVATLDTLGLTSLLLVLVGYGIGRFGDVTTVRSAQLPRVLLAVLIGTTGLMAGSILINFMLGTSVLLGPVLVRSFLPTLALNLVLAYPVFLLLRLLFRVHVRQRPEVASAG